MLDAMKRADGIRGKLLSFALRPRRRPLPIIVISLLILTSSIYFSLLVYRGYAQTGASTQKQQGGWAASFLHTNTDADLNAFFDEHSKAHRYSNCSGKSFRFPDSSEDVEMSADALESLLKGGDISLSASNDASSKGSFLRVMCLQVPCRSDGCCPHKFYFRPNTTDFKVFQQVYIWHYMRYLYTLHETFTPKYILDAGANSGFSTVLFKLLWPNASIVAVEPDAKNFEALMRNTAPFDGIYTLNGGLWGKKARIGQTANHGEWGRVFFSKRWYQRGGMPAYGVKDIAKRFDIPAFDLVKIDIEGAEGMVFAPRADTSWIGDAAVISLEVHDYFGAYFGLNRPQEISSRIDAKMKNYRHEFKTVSDNEHVMYISNGVVDDLMTEQR